MTLLLFFLGSFLVFTALGVGTWRFGGLGALSAYLKGEAVYLAPKALDIGSHEAGTKTVAVFKMTNLTPKEISVVGERSSCSCAFSEKIPISVSPGKTTEVRIGVRLPEHASTYDQTVTLMIAEPTRLAMHPVRITATVLNSDSVPVPTASLEGEASEVFADELIPTP